MNKPMIRIARQAAESMNAPMVLVVAFDPDDEERQVAGMSYGRDGAACKRVAKMLDQIMELLADGKIES